MTLIWSKRANQDLSDIMTYIAEDNPDAAQQVHDGINGHVERLREHPKLGKAGRLRRTRELVNARYLQYVVIYRVEMSHIRVLRVLRGSQQWPPDLSKSRSLSNNGIVEGQGA